MTWPVPAGAVLAGDIVQLTVTDPEADAGELFAALDHDVAWAHVPGRLLAYAFDTLGVGRVQLKTDVRNQRSQQAIARLGARYEGTLRRHFRRSDGTVRDSVLFSITSEDWPRVRASLDSRLRSIR